ncbi:MAG: type IX secretion system membrane protein PorP/SprF [Flavobacteriales bacterium]|nr:type IX secretion system membrane protein PorP/SprF [Flavobacteriales bacterium]
MRFFVILFLVLSCSRTNAQDATFSQYFSNPIYLNPAFAGYNGCPTIHTSYRNQWPRIAGNYQTANVSYDMLLGKRHGIGINYQYDNAAKTLESHGLSVIYAPVFRVFNKQLAISPAIEFGWGYRKLNTGNLTFGDLIDPRYGFYPADQNQAKNQKNLFDLNTGLLLTWKGLVTGFSAQHVTQPDEGIAGTSKLPVKLTGHISYQFNITEQIKISPAFIILHQQDFDQILPSISYEAYGARIGVAYRTSFTNPDAVIFMIGYRGYGVKVGYSYDYTVSSLTNNTGGSHEVSLAYIFKCKKSEFRKGVPLINF